MGEREWKPGDVATVRCGMSDWHTALRVGSAQDTSPDMWVCEHGGGNEASAVTEAHRLLVLDPDDQSQMESVRDALGAPTGPAGFGWQWVASALRRLIPPPPLEEPTGLGAVVEDAKGELWIRREGDGTVWLHSTGAAFAQHWRHLDVVKVLSEGVTA